MSLRAGVARVAISLQAGTTSLRLLRPDAIGARNDSLALYAKLYKIAR
jgi:hypothetical protein